MILNNKTWYSLRGFFFFFSRQFIKFGLSYSSVVVLSVYCSLPFYHHFKLAKQRITLSAYVKLHCKEILHDHIKHTKQLFFNIYKTQEVCPAILVLSHCPYWG